MPTHDLDDNLTLTLERDLPLAPFTSFNIGGPARFFTCARNLEELKEALLFARRQRLPFCILGGGTNLLVSDAGFDGMVIRMQMEGISVSEGRIEAEAGADLTGLVHQTAQWGLSGMESLAGIPGSLGGAIRGNAGAYGSCIGDVAETVSVLDSATLDRVTLDREGCVFRYRDSRFKRDPRLVVLSAVLTLTPGDPEQIREKVQATLARREARQLSCDRSAGSFFMNPVVTDTELIRRFESDQGVRCKECRIPAGWLIDQARLRTLRVGGAMVSHKHANYLINAGNASAEEMVELARQVKTEVQKKLGITLQEEVSCLGFTPPPQGQQPS